MVVLGVLFLVVVLRVTVVALSVVTFFLGEVLTVDALEPLTEPTVEFVLLVP